MRGEDSFGIDVIKELKNYNLKDTKLISVFQLTPELVLEIVQYSEIIFIDSCYSLTNEYSLACSIIKQNNATLSHHISPKIIISFVNNLYNKYPNYEIYSMLTNSFDNIKDKKNYENSIKEVVSFIVKQ